MHFSNSTPFLALLMGDVAFKMGSPPKNIKTKVIDFETTPRSFLIKVVNLESAHFLTEISAELAHFKLPNVARRLPTVYLRVSERHLA